jgi:hypothetical protein
MKPIIRRNLSTALATAALLVGLPRPAAGQTVDADNSAEASVPAESLPAVSAQAASVPVVSAPAVSTPVENVPVVSAPADSAPVVSAQVAPPSRNRLPIFGVMADVGLPDGIIASLTVRPLSWVRFSGGGGTNLISGGWRTGITLLPFGAGPSASFEYGRYQDGDANGLAKTIVGGRFAGSPALQRVGYDYMNAHLGLDLGFRRFVFFVHAGVTVLHGRIHNLDAAIRDTTTYATNATSTTEVVVPHDPSAKAVGSSVKLGLIVYIW